MTMKGPYTQLYDVFTQVPFENLAFAKIKTWSDDVHKNDNV